MKEYQDEYQETFATWEKAAKIYEDKFMHLDIYDHTYDVFIQKLNHPNATVLEIGCGPGNISNYLLSKSSDLNILGVDASRNMVELAKKNNPRANYLVLDARNLNSIQKKFDAIVCGFILPYLSKQDCRKLFSDCNKLLQSSGKLFLSFVQGNYDQSGYLTGSTGDRVYFYYHDDKALEMELQKHSFSLLYSTTTNYEINENEMENHTTLIFEKE
jgi:2-polyprenyl-3-methyl-5-hydroxy-6-metoxy-1,4-benzoquinol methylase